MSVLILLGFLALVALWGVAIYNTLVSMRTHVNEGWSGIETQLKRRANLIPNLVETVKGYAKHEQSTLEEVTSMRTRAMAGGSISDRAAAEGALTAALGHLMAVAEAYPDLKANENFKSLQGDLRDTEDQIQLARRYYNGTVRELNIKVQAFPSNLIANNFGFSKAEFFELENESERAVPQVSF